MILTHRDCGGEVTSHRICDRCGEPLGARDVRAIPGPSAPESHPLRRRAAAGTAMRSAARALVGRAPQPVIGNMGACPCA